MKTVTKTAKKTATQKTTKTVSAKDRIKPRGLVGIWEGKLKIVGDIDNAFNNYGL